MPGIDHSLLSVRDMYRADSLAMESGVSGISLMGKAGRAVAKTVCGMVPEGRVLVLCGPGNNGGDGFVAAVVLDELGYEVQLYSMVPISELKGDALHFAREWRGIVLRELDEADFGQADVIVDALFGAGLARPLDRTCCSYVEWSLGKCVVSVDIPSGVSGDTGELVGGIAFHAEKTVTFLVKKTGHCLYPGADWCGDVIVADIGIPKKVRAKLDLQFQENHPDLWSKQIPRYQYDQHKYHFGHSLVWGGQMSGAGRLVAMSALRAGSGLVTVLCSEADRLLYELTSPSLIVEEHKDPMTLAEFLKNRKISSFVLGAGGGRSDDFKSFVSTILESCSIPVVLDADAISVFEEKPEQLLSLLNDQVIITPHEGEFKRLFPEIRGSRLERARQAAVKAGCVLVLKGADTIITAPDGRTVINTNAPYWLARGGTGDVLAGIITGLLAQSVSVFEAACAGVWLHGDAAQRAGSGMIADDLLAGISGAIVPFKNEKIE
ncbi:NAD(P)H-hydrate dehydratase [Kiloniella sp. EL199]|uniref:NAD(P)H-hydrate dehydratase n=1 Tax=Kiloniella sp. EL199 TaxID=2107581 RepID=UPI000EA0474C|nr:NAD(P)H-hydrate dehydratase [Kiloniella sp. EL199]